MQYYLKLYYILYYDVNTTKMGASKGVTIHSNPRYMRDMRRPAPYALLIEIEVLILSWAADNL